MVLGLAFPAQKPELQRTQGFTASKGQCDSNTGFVTLAAGVGFAAELAVNSRHFKSHNSTETAA